jgi:hypothetical protein
LNNYKEIKCAGIDLPGTGTINHRTSAHRLSLQSGRKIKKLGRLLTHGKRASMNRENK